MLGDRGIKMEIMCGFLDHVEYILKFSLVDKTRRWIRMKREKKHEEK